MPVSSATVAFDEKLILEVQQYPNLLNKQLDLYKNRNVKRISGEEVAKKLGLSGRQS